jgi:ribonucleotide reductase alpha subunit
MALAKLGYTEPQIKAMIEYIDQHETIEGAPELKPEHLPVFDCAFKARNGERSIHYMGHIKMMGATQPFISGAISKTVNVPKEADRRGNHGGLHPVVEDGRQGHLDLPRRQQADAAAEYRQGQT